MNPIELRAVNRTGFDIEPIPFPQGGPFGKNVLPVNANVELVDAAVLMPTWACRPAPAPNPSVLRSQEKAQTMLSGTIIGYDGVVGTGTVLGRRSNGNSPLRRPNHGEG